MWHSRTFWTSLIALPLILLAGFLKPQPVDPLLQSRNIEERYWMVKTHSHSVYDMVAMGDSRMYRDVSPQVMGSLLPGWRILNFGYNSGGLNPTMFGAAETKLDPASRKKAMVLGVTPHSLTPSAAKNEFFNEKRHKRIDHIFICIFLPQLENFFAPIQMSDLFKKKKLPDRCYYQNFHDDGWVASWTVPEDVREALGPYREAFRNNKVDPELVKGVMDQTRNWVSRGIAVYAFRPPTTQAMSNLEDAVSGFNEASFVRQFKAAGGIWLPVRMDSYHSYDGSHLGKDSAIKFSEDLAKSIGENMVCLSNLQRRDTGL